MYKQWGWGSTLPPIFQKQKPLFTTINNDMRLLINCSDNALTLSHLELKSVSNLKATHILKKYPSILKLNILIYLLKYVFIVSNIFHISTITTPKPKYLSSSNTPTQKDIP